MAKAHTALINEILLTFSRGQIRLWPNQTGVAISPDGKRPIRYGLPGSADILGLAGPSGRFIAIEVKTPTDDLSDKQLAFKAMVLKLGGIYVLARSVKDVLESFAHQNIKT